MRPDSLPEYKQYLDHGCRQSPSCLSCPLEKCVLDDTFYKRRARDIKRRFNRGEDPRVLAAEYGLQLRAIRRIARKPD
jgi:hypothetical protein